MSVAMTAPAISYLNTRIRIGSSVKFRKLPSSCPPIAVPENPSARIVLENHVEMRTKGPDRLTINKYCFVYSHIEALAPISSRTRSMHKISAADIMMPAPIQDQKQKELIRLADSIFSWPIALDIADVPPTLKIVPTAMNSSANPKTG